MKHLLFDTETTGLNPRKSFIISNGAIIYDDVLNKTYEFYNLFNWGLIYDKFTTNPTKHIHRISDEELKKYGLHPLKAFSDFYDFIEKNGPIDVACAFNIAYDQNMYISNLLNLIKNNYNKNSIELEKNQLLLKIFKKSYEKNDENKIIFVDSMIIDRLFHFEFNYQKTKHDLNSVSIRYNFPEDPNAHNALSDTRRTFEIYKIQLEEIKSKNIEINQHFEERIIKQYKRNQERWSKSNQIDYLAYEMIDAKFE